MCSKTVGMRPVPDAYLPAAELPLLDAEGPVVLVCGDMLDALFQGSPLRKTAGDGGYGSATSAG